MKKNKIAVIGAGTMGSGIAHTFAQFGFEVILIDLNSNQLELASKNISSNLDRQIQKSILTEQDKIETLNRINFQNCIQDYCSDCELVIEAVAEKTSIKEQVLKQINQTVSSECIIASNTSSISITKLASFISNPSRFIGMHFMNPVPVMQLIEVISGYHTSKNTIDKILEFCKGINKTALFSEDYPGFVANRILMPMINEAIYTLHEGVANVSSIDGIMKLGMAHPMGPLQLADFIGLDVCLEILNVLYHEFKNPKYAPCVLLVNMVTAGQLGVKSKIGFYDYQAGIKNAIVNPKFNQ